MKLLLATPMAHDMPWALAYSRQTAITASKEYKKRKLRNKIGSDTKHYISCALKKIMMAEVNCSICVTICEVVISDTYGPWYAVSISLFTVNSYHGVQKNYQVENMIDGDTEDPRLCKNQTNQKTGKNE